MENGNVITRIEVRSVLTGQSPRSSLSDSFSINPYRGCLFACSYCLSPSTMVRTADLREKALGDVEVGDVLFGFDETPLPRRHQRYRHAVVEGVWWTRKPAYRIVTTEAEVVTTADHLWLTGTRKPVWRPTDRLTRFHSLRHVDVRSPQRETHEYRRGYITGMTLGDGTFRYVPGQRSDKKGFPQAYWRVALVEPEALDRLRTYMRTFGIELEIRRFSEATAARRPLDKVETRSLGSLEKIHALLSSVPDDDVDYIRGFVAGFFDAEGGHHDSLHMFQKDVSVLERVRHYCARLGFEFGLENFSSSCPSIRLIGDARDRMRFLATIRPAITSKVACFDGERFQSNPSRIVAIEAAGMEDVVDIRTGSRTFLANGLATHNCYASKFVFDDPVKRENWGRWVEIKSNAVDALQRESHKIQGKSVFFGSATDPYQPIELRVGLTRALLEVLLFAFPARIHLQTRSPHVVRDIELFQRFGPTLTVGISIPTDSEVVRKAFEPRAPSIPRRLAAAKQLKDAGIRVTASVAPLLPCTPERLARLIAPRFHSAWTDTLNFYDKGDPLRAIYAEHGWERYLRPEHIEDVRRALAAALPAARATPDHDLDSSADPSFG